MECSVASYVLNTTIKVEKEDTMDSCRVCMCKGAAMSNVFGYKSDKIVNELQYCTGILITKEDCLPTTICVMCLSNLKIAYNFKHTCLQSDEEFRKLLKDSIKKENRDDEYKKEASDVEGAVEVEPVTKKEPDICHDSDSTFFDNDSWELFCKAELSKVKRPRKRTRKKKDYPKTHTIRKVNIKVKSAKGDIDIQKDKSPADNLTSCTIEKEKKTKHKQDPLSCGFCKVQFETKEECTKHKMEQHKSEWVCEFCGKVFTHQGSLYSHVKLHLPPQFRCEHCDYCSRQKSDLVKHMRIHTGDYRYFCEYCTKSFHTVSNLYEHIKRNHGGKKTHLCHRCDAAFYTGFKLRRHLDSHDNIKRHVCEFCNSAFTRRCYWKKHLEKHHNVIIPPMRPGRHRVDPAKETQMSMPLRNEIK